TSLQENQEMFLKKNTDLISAINKLTLKFIERDEVLLIVLKDLMLGLKDENQIVAKRALAMGFENMPGKLIKILNDSQITDCSFVTLPPAEFTSSGERVVLKNRYVVLKNYYDQL